MSTTDQGIKRIGAVVISIDWWRSELFCRHFEFDSVSTTDQGIERIGVVVIPIDWWRSELFYMLFFPPRKTRW